MIVRRLAALAVIVVTACGAGATEEDTSSSDHELTVALGKSLVGRYQSVEQPSMQLELRADLTFSVVQGESGTWNMYNSPVSGHHYVVLTSLGTAKWLRVLQGAPNELVGVFGTDGSFLQIAP